MFFRIASVAAALALAFACSSSSSSSPSPSVSIAEGSDTFSCMGQTTVTCQSASEYCFVVETVEADGGMVEAASCVTKPSGCSDCACAQSDAKKNASSADHCSVGISCSTATLGDVSDLTVTCFPE